MKDEQRIAIAEACGWKYNGLGPVGTLHHPTNCTCFDGPGCCIPDYLNDLNAMHEVEKVLTDANSWLYHAELLAVQRRLFGLVTDREFQLVHATAAQRAEAFLRTLNLWKD